MQSSVCRVAECLPTPGRRQEFVAISFNFLYLKKYLSGCCLGSFLSKFPAFPHPHFVGLHFCNSLESHLVEICGVAGTLPGAGPGNFDL